MPNGRMTPVFLFSGVLWVRSNRKTCALEVDREGCVTLRTPLRVERAEAEAILRERAGWIDTHRARQEARRDSHPEPDPERRKELVRRARETLPGKVMRYAAIMGVSPEGITVTGARTRFGSCSPKNRLCFSWRLMQYPEEAIDAVVVHELAHILHKNHGKQFYQAVENVLPDYRTRVKHLKS